MRINKQKLEIVMARQCINKKALADKAGLLYQQINRACSRGGKMMSDNEITSLIITIILKNRGDECLSIEKIETLLNAVLIRFKELPLDLHEL